MELDAIQRRYETFAPNFPPNVQVGLPGLALTTGQYLDLIHDPGYPLPRHWSMIAPTFSDAMEVIQCVRKGYKYPQFDPFNDARIFPDQTVPFDESGPDRRVSADDSMLRLKGVMGVADAPNISVLFPGPANKQVSEAISEEIRRAHATPTNGLPILPPNTVEAMWVALGTQWAGRCLARQLEPIPPDQADDHMRQLAGAYGRLTGGGDALRRIQTLASMTGWQRGSAWRSCYQRAALASPAIGEPDTPQAGERHR